MEQGRTGLKGTAAAPDLSEAISAQNKTEQFDKIQRDFIYIATRSVGADLMEATGGAEVTPDNLLALQFRGYLDYSLDDIFSSHFDNLDDLNGDVRFAYEERLAERQNQTDGLMAEIEAADLPTDLFKKVEFAGIPGVSKAKTNKDGSLYYEKDVGLISEDEVDDSQKLTRYARYKLAKNLLGGVRGNVSRQRLAGIAMGIFLDEDKPESGRKISSYQSEIFKASNGAITQADVELAAEAAELYDLIYPERRQSYLANVRRAAEAPVIIPLSRKDQIHNVFTSEIAIDTARRRLLAGETAVRGALESGTQPDSIRKLGELLLQDSVDQRFGAKGNFKEWERQDYIRYGRWLLKVLEPYRANPDVYTLINAFQLGVGPSLGYIEREFGSSLDFYKEIDLVKKNGRYQFDDMTYDDILRFVQSVAAQNNGRVSMPILRKFYRQKKADGIDVPSYQTLVRLADKPIGKIIEDSGFKVKRKSSKEACAEAAAGFYRQNRRWPMVKEFSQIDGMPSWPTVRRYCGSMAGLFELAAEYLDDSNGVREILPDVHHLTVEQLAA